MTTADIRNTIAAARQQEQRTGDLRRKLAGRRLLLEEKLILPAEQPTEALMGFVLQYIESVPGCLNLVRAVSKQVGFYDYAAPLLHLAEDYFLQPPDVLPTDGGLEALLDEAFLAHRLLEEVNDNHRRHLQRPLLPLDMTEANLVVHHLLGDELATRLEHLVQFTASHLLGREHLWNKAKYLPGSEPAQARFTSNNMTGSPQQIRLRLSA